MENKEVIHVHLRLSAAYVPFSAACYESAVLSCVREPAAIFARNQTLSHL
jgi:hypothetical protein